MRLVADASSYEAPILEQVKLTLSARSTRASQAVTSIAWLTVSFPRGPQDDGSGTHRGIFGFVGPQISAI